MAHKPTYRPPDPELVAKVTAASNIFPGTLYPMPNGHILQIQIKDMRTRELTVLTLPDRPSMTFEVRDPPHGTSTSVMEQHLRTLIEEWLIKQGCLDPATQ